MKETHDEIRAIQSRLQAINSRDSGYRPTTPSSMVERFPASRPPLSLETTPPLPASQYLAYAEAGGRTGTTTATVPKARSTTIPSQPSADLYADYGVWPGVEGDRPLHPHTSPQTLTEQRAMLQLQAVWQQLEAKTQEVNQLSTAQEAALMELRAIAQRLERDWRATGIESFPFASINGDFSGLYTQPSTQIPQIECSQEGQYTLGSRTIDWLKAEREANRMAQELRQRRPNPSSLSPAGKALWQWLSQLIASTKTEPRLRRAPARKAKAAPLEDPSMSLTTATAWFVGAAVARLMMDALIVSYPMFWFPAVAIIITPAAITLYYTTVAPETSLKWGFRLLLILVGLLVGGRLF